MTELVVLVRIVHYELIETYRNDESIVQLDFHTVFPYPLDNSSVAGVHHFGSELILCSDKGVMCSNNKWSNWYRRR